MHEYYFSIHIMSKVKCFFFILFSPIHFLHLENQSNWKFYELNKNKMTLFLLGYSVCWSKNIILKYYFQKILNNKVKVKFSEKFSD